MLQSKKEQTLAAVLGIVLVVAVGKGFVYRSVVEPLSQKRLQISAAQRSLRQMQLEVRRLEAAQTEIRDFRPACLPSDASSATVSFQERMVEMGRLAGFADYIVTPMRSTELEPLGHRVMASIQGTADTRSVARLLDLLESDQIATRVSSLSIDRVDARENRISLNVEALSIEDFDDRQNLPRIKHPEKPSPLVTKVAKSDPFDRGYPPRRAPKRSVAATKPKKVQPPPKPKIDRRKHIRLIALVEVNGETLAWLYNSLDGREEAYRMDDKISVDDWSALVVSTQDDSLTLDVDGRTKTLRLGGLLSQI